MTNSYNLKEELEFWIKNNPDYPDTTLQLLNKILDSKYVVCKKTASTLAKLTDTPAHLWERLQAECLPKALVPGVKPISLSLSKKDFETLLSIRENSRFETWREKSSVILAFYSGAPIKEIAKHTGIREANLYQWRSDFLEHGIESILSATRYTVSYDQFALDFVKKLPKGWNYEEASKKLAMITGVLRTPAEVQLCVERAIKYRSNR